MIKTKSKTESKTEIKTETKTNWEHIREQVLARQRTFPARRTVYTHQEFMALKERASELALADIADVMKPTTWLEEADKGIFGHTITIPETPEKEKIEAKEVCSQFERMASSFHTLYPGFMATYSSPTYSSAGWKCSLAIKPIPHRKDPSYREE